MAAEEPLSDGSALAGPRSARDKAILFFASCFGLGYVGCATGTVTVAVLGIPLFYLIHTWSVMAQLGLLVVVTAVGVWLSDVGERILDEKDSNKLVIDEIVGYLVAIIGLPWTWPIVAVTFFIERVIDIVKVPPANIIEDRVPGGWGVVLDDVVAGLYTLGIVKLLIWLAPGMML